MHLALTTTLLGSALLVSGAAIPNNTLAAPVPLVEIPKIRKVISPKQILADLAAKGLPVLNGTLLNPPAAKLNDDFTVSAAATGSCTNPRVRMEWDSLSNDDKHAYVNAINCLRSRPASGNFPPAGNRYEDLVRLHQSVTLNVHENAKFLIWHRYFVWVFEDMLRTECGYDRTLPWWDEGRNTGRFAASSVFSSEFFGSVAIGGACVTDGVFANSNLNIGPGDQNRPTCMSRAGDISNTRLIDEALVNTVNSWPDYQDMAKYAEGSFHAFGHLGVGGTQSDMYASPGDPWFWLHHAYVDRNYANWQGMDANTRLNYINGNDRNGNPLNLDVMVYMNGLRPDVRIRDIIDVQGEKLCYTYQY